MERLSKVLALSGVASRRKAETLISDGKVKVNGQVVNVLGTKVSQKDIITVDGKVIEREPLYYFLVNKPTGCMSTTTDIHKRKVVTDLFDPHDLKVRLYPISKLEFDAAGVLILTNDGTLTKYLTQSSMKIESEYNVRVDGIVIKEKIRTLRRGIKIKDDIVIPKFVQITELNKGHQSTLIRLIMDHADTKLIRLMFKALDHDVKNITRIRYDFLTVEGVERGSYRTLKSHEVKKLYRDFNDD